MLVYCWSRNYALIINLQDFSLSCSSTLYSFTAVYLPQTVCADVVCFERNVAWSIWVNTSYTYCFRNSQFRFSFSNVKPPVENIVCSRERHALLVMGSPTENLVVSSAYFARFPKNKIPWMMRNFISSNGLSM